MITALGIDPGIAITGFAVITQDGRSLSLREYGVIRTPQGTSLPDRLVQLNTDLFEVLLRYPHIDVAGIEELFFAKNAKTAFMVGQARGVILHALASKGLRIHELKPVEVKSLITGNGQAKKNEVQRMVQLNFRLSTLPEPDDAADAVAIAMAAAAQYHMGIR